MSEGDKLKELDILSLGAGVQSTTVALLAVHGEIKKPEHAIFADTGWEPKEVYDHLQWLKPIMEEAGIQVHIVKKGNLRDDALSLKLNAYNPMPVHTAIGNTKTGLGRRVCTNVYKIQPVNRKARELIGLKYRQRWTPEHGYINNLMGISVDEIQRAKDNRVPYIKNKFPLLELRMKRQDCLNWLDKHGYSAPRSACIGCPYHSDFEWRRIKRNPEEWADAVAFDKAIRHLRRDNSDFEGEQYLHTKCVPLDEVDLDTEEDKGQMTLFDNECEGMCGI